MNIPLWIAAKSLQQWCHEIELTSTLLSYQHQIWLTCRYPDYLVLSTFCKSPSELRAPYEPPCPWHFQVCWHSSQAAVLAVWVPWHRSLIGGAVSTPLASAIRLNFCALLFCCYKLHIEFTLPLPFSRWWRHSSFAEWRMAGNTPVSMTRIIMPFLKFEFFQNPGSWCNLRKFGLWVVWNCNILSGSADRHHLSFSWVQPPTLSVLLWNHWPHGCRNKSSIAYCLQFQQAEMTGDNSLDPLIGLNLFPQTSINLRV